MLWNKKGEGGRGVIDEHSIRGAGTDGQPDSSLVKCRQTDSEREREKRASEREARKGGARTYTDWPLMEILSLLAFDSLPACCCSRWADARHSAAQRSSTIKLSPCPAPPSSHASLSLSLGVKLNTGFPFLHPAMDVLRACVSPFAYEPAWLLWARLVVRSVMAFSSWSLFHRGGEGENVRRTYRRLTSRSIGHPNPNCAFLGQHALVSGQ